MNDKAAKYSAMTLDRELRHSNIDRYVNINIICNMIKSFNIIYIYNYLLLIFLYFFL